jgi:hypothetical protein
MYGGGPEGNPPVKNGGGGNRTGSVGGEGYDTETRMFPDTSERRAMTAPRIR